MADLPRLIVSHFADEPNAKARRRRATSCPTSATSAWRGPWAVPGTPGLEHRIGGLEKEDVTGNVSYDPANHEAHGPDPAEKIANIADDIPPLRSIGPREGDLLVVGWGGTYGAIRTAVQRAAAQGPVGRPGPPALPQPDAGATPARC